MPAKTKTQKTTRGIVIALLSGIPLGLFYPLFTKGAAGEFGLGPYAGILLFSVGVVLSTIIFNFYFMNIAVEGGGAIRFNAYFEGNVRQHFLGFAGGAIWAFGVLAAALGTTAPADVGISDQLRFLLPLASVFVVVLSGLFFWREFPASSGNARLLIALTVVFFLGALALVGMGLTR
jgi:hypothetical protein